MTQKLPAAWMDVEQSLQRDYDFKSFKDCLRFMAQVGEYCDKANHHPEWTNVYDQLSVRLCTHEVDKVTEKDYALAAHMEQVFQQGYAKAK